jgi:thiol-disulfide isomerase/thioredoxin
MTRKVIICFLIFSSFTGLAQGGYRVGETVQNFQAPAILNYTTNASSFNGLKNKLTILDFFGTWCVPCRKALPGLIKLQQKHKDALSVVLISVEEEGKLQSFLEKQKGLPFPVVVDGGEKITSLFQPPSLPYTVIVNEGGEVLAITEAGEITGEKMMQWLAQKGGTNLQQLPIAKMESLPSSSKNEPMTYSNNTTVRLSQDFIYAAKTGEGAAAFTEQLKNIDYQTLKNSLKTDVEKKAFWINLYNGYTQVLLKGNPDKYKDRSTFFSSDQIQIAGKDFSLDDIEHGILRHSKIKWTLGHFNKLFPGKTEKELRVDKVDYRIHFALNCGAKSCPPIAYYAPEKLETQLELATKNYLNSESEYKAEENKIYLPAIMGWFRADFGGKKGMMKILKKNEIVSQDAAPKIVFKKYDWSLYLDNYRTVSQ